ncbi:hypothetical protein ACFLZO_01450, partial [Patescibacteria group bacterium]
MKMPVLTAIVRRVRSQPTLEAQIEAKDIWAVPVHHTPDHLRVFRFSVRFCRQSLLSTKNPVGLPEK